VSNTDFLAERGILLPDGSTSMVNRHPPQKAGDIIPLLAAIVAAGRHGNLADPRAGAYRTQANQEGETFTSMLDALAQAGVPSQLIVDFVKAATGKDQKGEEARQMIPDQSGIPASFGSPMSVRGTVPPRR